MITMKTIFENAETLVYDPVASNRNATRASLHSLGFRNIEFAASLEALTTRLKMCSPDLLLCEVAGAETEVCRILQHVRQGRLCANPFIVCIATTWRRDSNIVNMVLNSGADDLLARPFSASMLGERVATQIERRKGFVVTSDYIGPDRRRDPSRSGAECVEVPNSLKMKTAGGLSRDEAERRIFAAVRNGKEKLNLEKMRRDAFQLCVQWRLLDQRRQGSREFFEIVGRIAGLAIGIRERAKGTSKEHALEWCEAAVETAREIFARREECDAGQVPDFTRTLQMLSMAAMSLGGIFAPGEVAETRLVELDEVIARIDVRRARAPVAAAG